MSAPPDDFLAFLAVSRRAYLEALPARVAGLEALWARVSGGEGGESLAELERAAHSIAGSAGTFGVAQVGEAGRRLEIAAKRLAGMDPAGQDASLAEARFALDAMHHALEARS